MTDLVPATHGSMWVALEQSGSLTPRSLILPEGVSEEECSGILGLLKGAAEISYFAQGDLFIYVKDHYGDEALVKLIEERGMNYHSCENKMSLCRNVAPDVRREDLSFGHHDVVRKLPNNEQKHFLKLASENGWTRQQLRDEVYGQPVLPPAVSPSISTVARDLLAGAKEMGDGWLISRDSYVRLKACLEGEG